jgi:hypothetical protein
LKDLQAVTERLRQEGLNRNISQALLGRSIFIRYLTDRGIIGPDTFRQFGSEDLEQVLRNRQMAYRLFDWIRSTFNGDLFPVDPAERRTVQRKHLELVAGTLAGVSPITGQGSLWSYEFDVIPIELISSIYEQFAHAQSPDSAEEEGLHYTPISLVSLVLDEVLWDVDLDARILDMTCGSGVFLVEALRRIVKLKSHKASTTRQIVRKTLHEQIFGFDKNEAAIRVASFSLYLTALELDPDPRPPEALRFEPLIGRNLFVADALNVRTNQSLSAVLNVPFDAIIGNPPWTYSGKDATPTWPRENTPFLPPRSQDFAFIWRAIELADENTRFGIVMRATPFFSAAEASRRARNQLLERLAPVALVNLAALREELFPTAEYPAVVLLARLPKLRSDKTIPIISIPWTSAFARSGSFDISPSDVRFAPLKEIEATPQALKAFAIGSPRDRLLLLRLSSEMPSFEEVLAALGLTIITGIQPLAGDRRDASALLGLPLLSSGELKLWIDTRELSKFSQRRIHRPRARTAFRGPLMLLGEGLRAGRVAVGLSKKDLVYTRSYYGISFAGTPRGEELAACLAGVLHSAVASWHLLLTGSEFGIHKRKALLQDIIRLPMPNVDGLKSEKGRAVAEALRLIDWENAKEFSAGLGYLDEAVYQLFALSAHERLVVQEGLARAEREYVAPRIWADQPALISDVKYYARPFLDVLNAWVGALGRWRFDAEVFNVRNEAPLRVVRFITSAKANGEVRQVNLPDDLNETLAKIGARMRLPITERLAAVRELRVHADGEVFIVKPAARRYWTPATGLNDADAALGDGLMVVAA